MELPSREALLDIEWLAHTHAAEGFASLVRYLRRGAETYGGPVTAIAEALLNARPLLPQVPLRSADQIDLRNGLAHRLLTGSWTTDPAGPAAHGLASASCWLWMFPPEKRAELLAKLSAPPCDPPLPNLRQLRLIEPLDRAWAAHTDGIWGCEVSRDGKYVASASRDGDVAVWDMERGTLVARGVTGEPEIRDCAITSDAERVISVHGTGRITVWDLRTMTVVAAFDAPPQRPLCIAGGRGSLRRWRRIAISPDGACLAVAGSHAIDLWDLDTCARITRLVVESDNVHGILAVYFRSNSVLTCISRESPAAVVTWVLDSRQIIDRAEQPLPQGAWQRALVTPNQEYLVAASGNDTTVWRLDTRACVAGVTHGIAGQAIAISSDGELAATAGHGVWNSADWVDDRFVRLWSLPHLREICRWNLPDLGCRDIVCALAFSPDGGHLVLAGWEGVLRRLILPNTSHNQ